MEKFAYVQLHLELKLEEFHVKSSAISLHFNKSTE